MNDNQFSERLGRGWRTGQSPGLFLALTVALTLVLAGAAAFVDPTSEQCVGDCAWAQVSSCGNAILEPPEQCDPPGSITCPPGSPAQAFLPCNQDCTCPTIPPTTITPTTSSTSTTTLLNHFQCYELRKQAITAGPVTVQDQFGTTSVTLSKPVRLCAPTNKQNEDPGAQNDPDHLLGWQDKHNRPKVLNQTIVNQFGTLVLDISKPAFLFVPASKDLQAQPPPLVPPTVDHFQCYKARRSRGSPKFVKIPGVTGQDQFGPYSVDLMRPRYLCAPANKAGGDPTAPSHPEHLLCYKSRNNTSFARRTTFVRDQFGVRNMLIHRRIELCVPSLKNPGATTTSSTIVATTTTSSTGPVTTTSQGATTSSSSTVTTSSSTTVTTSSSTSTTLYGSPSRAFVEPVRSLLD